MSTYEISKSSFLSLKAEIVRKREELAKAKAGNEEKIKIIKKNTPLELKNKGVEARIEADRVEEDLDILRQSRSALEHKSRLYDKLSSGNVTEDQKKRFLVRFDCKKKSKVSDLPPSDDEDDVDKYPECEEDSYHSDDNSEKNPEEKWVDYVDCLGRTRKCLQKDLKYLKVKDEELRKTMEERRSRDEPASEEPKETINEDVIQEGDDGTHDEEIVGSEELISSDMKLGILRKKWEEDEERLRNKSDIHYQDILFDEARTHGAGYYAFSVDEEERLKQQEALKKLREETKQKQKSAQELKAIREKQLAARIKAAKDRKRARLGLPPEEEEPELPAEPQIPEEELKKQEEEKRKQEEKEKLLEAARKHHVRPWDVGKEGVKEHYEMTQEEWVEMKRKERLNEFAPPTAYRKEFRSTFKKDISDETNTGSLKFTTKKNTHGSSKVNAPKKEKYNNRKSEVSSSTDSYSVPFRNYQRDFQEISQSAPVDPTPIVDLCESSDFDDHLLADYRKTRTETFSCDSASEQSDDSCRGKGTEIAPPLTYDYYGPSQAKISKSSVPAGNIEDSIEAGLKFLRRQVEIKEKSTKHPTEMFIS